jgi:uncharacterized delta-60 repeat protein
MMSALRTRCLFPLLGCLLFGAATAAAGSSTGGAGVPATPVRVDLSGSLDPGFGVGGVAQSPVGGPERWEAVIVRTDGAIVTAGSASSDLVIGRFDPTGAPDPSFGEAGLVTAPLPHGGRARAVATTGGGDLVVVGSAYGDPESGFPTDVAVLRFDADGTPDAGFGDGGVVTIDLGQRNDEATAVVVQGSGRIVVLADSNAPELMSPAGTVVLFGLRPDGRPDPAFGDAGRVEMSGAVDEEWSADAMVRTANGDLLVALSSYDGDDESSAYRFRLVRFDRDGRERWTTGGAGYAIGLGVLVDDTIVLHGSFIIGNVGAAAAFLRFDDDGALDTTLGEDGLITSAEDRPGLVAIDPQNRIVVAAERVARHYSDGVLDESFGDDGFAENSRSMVHRGLALQSDGKILTAGEICLFDPQGGFSGCLARLVRYESDATQLCGDADGDETFSVTDGVATLRAAVGLASACSYAVCDVDGDGTIGVTDGVNVLRAAADLPAALMCGAGLTDPSR